MSAWHGVAQGERQSMTQMIVLEIAERLAGPGRVAQIADNAYMHSSLPFPPRWTPYSIVFGPPSLALFYGHLDRCFPCQGWDVVAHQFLASAIQGLENIVPGTLSSGLMGGLAGLGFTTLALSHGGKRYVRLTRQVDQLLLDHLTRELEHVTQNGDGVWFGDYDLVSGSTGILAYLLARQEVPGVAITGLDEVIEALLDRLITRCADPASPNGFFIPKAKQATPELQEAYPFGCVNIGLAHGVPGPLGVLSVALLCNVQRIGLPEAVASLAAWIMERRVDDSWGISWPHAVRPTEDPQGESSGRAAWCYGSPGVAASLWLAGKALSNDRMCRLAVDALKAVARRPISERRISSPIICHGVAGLLQIVLRLWNYSHDPELEPFAAELLEQLVAMHDVQAPVGYRDIEPSGQRVDDPGFLQGAAGIALSLISASTAIEPTWDRILLLS